jgi:glycosyltransferase involved in cell wall biosynthesis
MRIAFDGQAFQIPNARDRGIGRYSFELLSAQMKIAPENEYIPFYNALHGRVEDPFEETGRAAKGRYVEYVDPSDFTNLKGRLINSLLQEMSYSKAQPDIVHILHPFEFPPNAIIAEDLTRIRAGVVSTIYDLIPLIFSDRYLDTPDVRLVYFRGPNVLHQSDMIISISECTRKDAINLLAIPEDRVVNVGAGCSRKFHKLAHIEEPVRKALLGKFGISGKFVLYTGGIDFRKNMGGLVESFSELKPGLLRERQLVLVCRALEPEKESLARLARKLGISEKVVFTGFVSDGELNMLYNLCELFVFPSFYEGFGLPILEAMKCGAPVLASGVSSMPEVVGRTDCLFDPYSKGEMAQSISRVLSNEGMKRELSEYGLQRSKEFTWERVARRTLDVYRSISPGRKRAGAVRRAIPPDKPRIAYFSPLPPMRSGISDYSRELVPYLARHFEIDIFVDDYEVSDRLLKFNYRVFHCGEYEKLAWKRGYIFPLYHFGNSEFHIYMYDSFMRRPGPVVLHDFFLSGLIGHMSSEIFGDTRFLVEEIRHSHGERGERHIEEALRGECGWEDVLWELPVNRRILEMAPAVIVHSEYAKNSIRSWYPGFDKPVYKINQHAPALLFSQEEKDALKSRYKIGKDRFVVSSFGFAARIKRLDVCVRCFSGFARECPEALFLIVGQIHPTYRSAIKDLTKDLGIEDRVIITGHVSEQEYRDYLFLTDVSLNLRYPTRGETSRSLLQALGAGIPCIVNEDAYFSELPDDVVIKAPLGEEDKIVNALRRLYCDTEERTGRSRRSRAYIKEHHSVDKTSEAYRQALYDIWGRYPLISEEGAINYISGRLKEGGYTRLSEKENHVIVSHICSLFGGDGAHGGYAPPEAKTRSKGTSFIRRNFIRLGLKHRHFLKRIPFLKDMAYRVYYKLRF